MRESILVIIWVTRNDKNIIKMQVIVQTSVHPEI